MASWVECESIIGQFSSDYSMYPWQHQIVYEYAMGVPNKGVAMELGICYGRTAALLAYCAKARDFEAHGIDAFFLVSNVSANGLRNRMLTLDLPYTIHEGLTSDQPINYKVGELSMIPWDRELDLLIIDASHTDPWVSADCKRWTPFVKVGGVAIFHDVEVIADPSSPHYDTYVAAHKYTEGWKKEIQQDGLLICRKIQ